MTANGKKKGGGQAFNASRESIWQFDPDDVVIETDPTKPFYQVPETYQPSEEFVLNVLWYGVQEPVLVWKDGDRAVIIAGRRRTLACREAKRRREAAGEMPPKLPGRQVKGAVAHLSGIMQLENDQRRELDAVTRGEQYARLASQGYTVADLVLVSGRTAPTIKQQILLGSSHFTLRAVARDGRMSLARAYKLASKSHDEQVASVERLLAGKDEAPPPKPKKPSRRLLTRLVEEKPVGLHPQALAVLRWSLGDEAALAELPDTLRALVSA